MSGIEVIGNGAANVQQNPVLQGAVGKKKRNVRSLRGRQNLKD